MAANAIEIILNMMEANTRKSIKFYGIHLMEAYRSEQWIYSFFSWPSSSSSSSASKMSAQKIE